MKKLLLVANVSNEHIRKFHIPFILKLKSLGWQVDVACRMDAPIPECDHAFDLPCDRNPFSGGLFKSISILKKIIQNNRYDVVHCNTVTGSIIGRQAAKSFRKQGLKVFYTNHGLHFFKGAPLSRWFWGYPMEKFFSSVTDVLITINSEDHQMAHKYLSACGAIEYIHGIGVDLSRFRTVPSGYDRNMYRSNLGLSPSDFVLTYVAELNDNKNQSALLEVLSTVRTTLPSAKLLLVGPEHDNGALRACAKSRNLSEHVLFLGWRSDISELLHLSDVYTASSKSEGLGLNIIEAMACNLPVVAFKNRGHCAVIQHKKNGFLVEQNNTEKMAEWILVLKENQSLRQSVLHCAQKDIEKYETASVLQELAVIYNTYT